MGPLRPTKRFEKSFLKLDERLRTRVKKSLEQFMANPRHPHLHFEKLSTGYHTIRVDMNFRIVLRPVEGGGFDIVDVGSHKHVDGSFG